MIETGYKSTELSKEIGSKWFSSLDELSKQSGVPKRWVTQAVHGRDIPQGYKKMILDTLNGVPKVKSFSAYKEKDMPHIVEEYICLQCLHRWISVRPEGTLLKSLECPNCGKIGKVIATGETILDDITLG